MATYNNDEFAVEQVLPSGFTEYTAIGRLFKYTPNTAVPIDSAKTYQPFAVYANAAKSADGNCLLIYPFLMTNWGDYKQLHKKNGADIFTYCRQAIAYDLQYSCGHQPSASAATDKDTHARINSYGGKKARKMGGADSIYIVDFPTTIPLKGNYTHVIGIYMAKKDNTPIFMKLFLTDKGYKHRDKALSAAEGCMAYTGNALAGEAQRKTDFDAIAKEFNHQRVGSLHHGN